MSRAVYSQQFIVYTDAAPITEYLVPVGFRAVVRDFTAYVSVAATLCQLQLGDSEAAPLCTFASLELAGVGSYEQWYGRVVIPGGGVLVLDLGSLAAGASVYAGGYLLRETSN